MARLPDRDRDSLLAQPDAERQSRQAAADDGDGFQSPAWPIPFAAR